MKNKRHSFSKIESKKKNKEPLKPLFKRQMLVTTLSVVLVLVITLTTSLAIFTKTGEGSEYNVVQVGELELSYVDLNDEGNVLQLADSYPISDTDGESSTPYRFSVENTGTIIANYTVKIVEDTDTIEADGCSDNLLDNSYLRYKFDNETSQNLSDKLDATSNEYVIYSGTLEPFESNIHEIRIWINENSPNSVLGTHYHGKVVIDVEQNNATDPYERPVKPTLADIFKDKVQESTSTFPNFKAISSASNGRGIYKYTEDGEDIYYWRGKVDEVEGAANHLLFANLCWEIVRTTKTGGVKIIYDGTPVEVDGVKTCPNTGTASQLTSTSKFNSKILSPAYVGYMYGNTVYEYQKKTSSDAALTTAGILYGYDVNWTGTEYELKAKDGGSLFASTGSWSTDRTSVANGNHYTCFDSDGKCETVSYVYYTGSSSYPYYIDLSGGTTIEKALEQMYSNEQPSTIKTNIETWFESTDLDEEENLSKLEDVVYCNDRSVTDTNHGWSKDGDASKEIYYSSYTRRESGTPDLSCRQTLGNRDRFTYKDTVNGNGLLKWPVGLLTADEIILAGGQGSNNSDYYLYTGQNYWAFSPYCFDRINAYEFHVSSYGVLNGYYVGNLSGVRPVVSLAAGTEITGLGTANSPFEVK